ncbi:hypothetical protein F4861DRAFT_205465 [Xylaria intraflava]|nr:hypothetical protein F4861DRAFT_205465 [Xylaria intraflava]
MRAKSLSKRKTSPLTRAPASAFPSPLHIIKRTKTVEFHPSTKRESSIGSVDYGPDRPLSVMKKRQRRGPASKDSSSAHAYEDQAIEVEPTCKIGIPTPFAVNHPRAQQQSRPPSRLGWFSRQRTSSSGTTCRRYNSRGCSISSNGSSIGRFSGSRCLDEADSEPFRFGGSTQIDTSILSTPTSVDYADDCHLLVPRISITPEVQASNSAISMAWVAIEISVQLSRPSSDATSNPYAEDSFLFSSPQRAGSVSRFGYIYDLQVNVLPVPQTTIIELIPDNKKRNLSLGSTMLVLAKIQIDRRRLPQPSRSITHKSDELIADLENQLGLAMFRCFQVQLRYSHSGFTTPNHLMPTEGTMDCQTRLETTVSGVIEQQALRSPPGRPHVGTGEGSVFKIVASHWGSIRANEIFPSGTSRQGSAIVTANVTPVDRHSAIATTGKHNFKFWPDRESGPSTPLAQRQADPLDSSPDQEDPAHKIWTAMRRGSLHSRPSMRAGNAAGFGGFRVSEKAATITGSTKLKADVDRRRDLIRDVALRNKRSIGADSLKSLVPSMMSLEVGSQGSSHASDKENVPPWRKKEGRWSLGGWW